MAIRDYHLPPIPDGFQIFEERLEVAGVSHRKKAAARFVRQQDQWLEYEPDPTNPFDENAIRILGCWKGLFGGRKCVLLGYVPREVARVLVEAAFVDQTRPRLLKTFLSHHGYVEILFQIIGPKSHTHEYRELFTPENGHYTDYVARVKFLKHEGRLQEAEELLLQLISATEAEAGKGVEGWGVAPWYYEQLAIVYRKQRCFDDEIAVLERYEGQPKAPGAGPAKLAARLEKARARRAR